MPLSKSIRDIFVPLAEYPSIRESASFLDAYKTLHAGYISGKRYRHILVLNDSDQLVGLLGLPDILRGMFPDYLRTQELDHNEPIPEFPNLSLIWAKTSHEQSREAVKKPVHGFMGPVPRKVDINDPITKAAYLMVIHDSSVLLVVDDDKLMGVVRIIDVFNESAKMVLYD